MDPFTTSALLDTVGIDLDGLLGDVLGFVGNLSCIGSATSPKQEKQWIENHLNPYYQLKLSQINVENLPEANSKLNNLYKDLLTVAYRATRHKTAVTAQCSKDGFDVTIQYCNQLATKLIKLFNDLEGYNVSTKQGTFNPPLHKNTISGLNINWGSLASNVQPCLELTLLKVSTDSVIIDNGGNSQITNGNISDESTQSLAGGGMLFGIILLLVWLSGGFKKLTQKAKTF